ncbi:MAG: TonB-dependent receptor, partial [candidate division Zixibacteria bacterium]|nr:TonB-dependent receptor [candidate division Zixibacteria bacterium]
MTHFMGKSKMNLFRAGAVSIFLLILAPAGLAQPEGDSLPPEEPSPTFMALDQPAFFSRFFLDELVESAYRYPKSNLKIPFLATVLSRDNLDQSRPGFAMDLLRTLPSVEAADGGSFAARPVIRGLSGSRVLLLADGDRLNNFRQSSFSGTGLSLVDLDDIEKIEVIHGPGAVLYGTDALGATVNLISKPLKFNESGRSTGVRLKMRYSTNENQFKGDLKVTRAGEKVSFSVNIGSRSATDYSAPGDLIVPNSSLHANNLDLKAGYKINETHKFIADFQSLKATNFGFPGLPNQNFDGAFFYPESYRGKFSLTYEAKNIKPNIPLMKAKFYVQSQNQERDFQFMGALNSTTITEVKTLGLSGQELILIHPYQLLTWGIDYYRESVEGSKITFLPAPDSTPPVPSANTNVVGIYAQDEITPAEKFTLLAGGRFEYSQAQPQDTKYLMTLPPSRKESFLSFNFGGLYRLQPNVSVHANFSRSYRIPNLVERYYFGAAEGVWVASDPELKREEGLTLEAGLKANLETMAASVNLFISEYQEFIQLMPGMYLNDTLYQNMRVWQWRNTDGAVRIDGIEAEWEGEFTDHFYGFANASYLFGHQRSDSAGIAPIFVPPFKIYYGIGWQERNAGSVWLEIAGRLVNRQDRVP